jgi:rod shape-determining protein MreC
MNKGLRVFFVIFIALLSGAIYFSNAVQSPFISASNDILDVYFNFRKSISNAIDEHINQQEHIKELKLQLADYEKTHLLLQQVSSELNSIYKEGNTSLRTDPQVQLVRTISYVRFADINRLWLEMKEYNPAKVYGLVYKDTVAGITVSYANRPVALLNGDIKCTYAVNIGENSAPGIARGNNDGNIIVNFVPAWIPVKVGDEVTTSGLDKIFFKGLKVGKVKTIFNSQGFQTLIIEPSFKAKDPRYLYAIKEVI